MTEAPTRVCIVGAGAVALVYARYLQNAGAEVSLLVKPQYGDFCRKGFQLHRFGYRGRIRDERLVISSILTRVDEVAEGAFDQIWLTVASDALREPWLDELLAASGEAVVVLLQPDLDDRMLLLERVEAARLVQGLIGFLSFQSPLPRAPNLPKGIGYTLLPGAGNVFDGSRADDVVAVLRTGGMSARRQSDLPGRSAIFRRFQLQASALRRCRPVRARTSAKRPRLRPPTLRSDRRLRPKSVRPERARNVKPRASAEPSRAIDLMTLVGPSYPRKLQSVDVTSAP